MLLYRFSIYVFPEKLHRAKLVGFFSFRGRVMSLIKYLNHRQKFFASVLPSILPCAQISNEVQFKVFPDETSPNGEIYVSPTVAPPESPLPVPLSPLPPHVTGIMIGRLPPSSDAAAKSATKALVSTKEPSSSMRKMIWILKTSYRGG